MALLQISEPGMTPDPHQRRLAVGIDLGTTHSLVAAVRHGVAECLPDAHGRVILPSVVRYLPPGSTPSRQVGDEALAAQIDDPANTVSSVKRLMGRALADVQRDGVAARLPYTVAEGPGGIVVRTVAGDKTPVEISADILATLRQRAEQTLGGELYGAVITVPAYFDDAQRQATKDAARLAGLNVLRLLNEPTAAAIAYGLDQGSEGLYLVYDLGGGTFDVSLLRLTKGVFEVVATGGDSALGGDDYDRALAAWVLQRAGRRETLETLPASDRARLLAAARQAKEALSSAAPGQPVALSLPVDGGRAVTVTLEDLHQATHALTERTLALVQRVLRDARVTPADVQGVVMVGGSTRMPLVQRAVHDLFGRAPLTNLNPDEVVALGAAIQAHQLAGHGGDDWLLLDVTPLSLGIETMGGIVERIVPRNTPIPTARAQDFTTFQDGQTALSIHVVQGERELARDCRSLARFTLRGIPPMAAGAARIRVTFTLDADGLLTVRAQELSTGVEAHVEVKPSYGLTDEQVARMLQDSFAAAQADMRARALAEARVEAERLLAATASALQADGDLLDPAQRQAIEALMQALQTQAAGQDAAAIEAATQALARGTEAFAARRMNRSIARALAGRHVESI
ncbi:MAG: Fe-S protein assembly chaperone HscA [Tepidimonas sp.]|uniref:Fe-S protein assembly chaperone HscA n=1 Tax=Tepidimonas sp. TaxID=2002775 RepID=UPI00298EF2DA|nr:Fe-S protein assembly chaperone HscA [Tepidimonas sp.]MDW8336483.1 Fe-S protein assembly chaperone HscA [Tepidimonas sp.]